MTAHPNDFHPECSTTPASTTTSETDAPTTPPTKPLQNNAHQFTLIKAPSALTATLATILQSVIVSNDDLPPTPIQSMTVFHALEAPSIPVRDYVLRVSKYVFCSDACLVAAYHYMTKVIKSHANLPLCSLTVHRLFITAVVLACKYFDDLSYNLAYYARVGGLPPKELANLEIHMLRMLDFRLDISPQLFVQLEQNLLHQINSIVSSSSLHPSVAPLAADARLALVDHSLLVDCLPTSPVRHSDYGSPSPCDSPPPTTQSPKAPRSPESCHASPRSAASAQPCGASVVTPSDRQVRENYLRSVEAIRKHDQYYESKIGAEHVISSPVTSEGTQGSLSRNPSTDSMSSVLPSGGDECTTQCANDSSVSITVSDSCVTSATATNTDLLKAHGAVPPPAPVTRRTLPPRSSTVMSIPTHLYVQAQSGSGVREAPDSSIQFSRGLPGARPRSLPRIETCRSGRLPRVASFGRQSTPVRRLFAQADVSAAPQVRGTPEVCRNGSIWQSGRRRFLQSGMTRNN